MNDNIQQVSLKFSCDRNWDNMLLVDGGRFCNHCNKKVYDLTNSKTDEFRKILSENANLCGMFRKEQVVSVGSKLPLWKKWLSAAVLLIGVNIFNKAEAQLISDKRDSTKNTTVTEDQRRIFGSVENSAEFPGGLEKFSNFIKQNIHYSGDECGRVIVQFLVAKDGSLKNIKVVRSLSPEADAEALRVVNLSPKWKPGIMNGKPVKQQYTLPIFWKASR